MLKMLLENIRLAGGAFTNRIRTVLIILFIAVFGFTAHAQTTKATIPDGLYLIDKIDTVATQTDSLSSKQIAVYFSKLFEDYNTDNEYLRLIIDTTQYVPIELKSAPIAEQQTATKKKLLLSLTETASEKLKTFTTTYVLRHVALVINGEVLTMHKIKEPLTSGQLQITRCNDNACQLLYTTLKDNVKKKKG